MSSSPETFDPFPRPGDADFTSFPKELPDDTAKYSVRVIQPQHTTPAQRRSRLSEVLSASKKLARDLLKDFIWQREAFSLDFNGPDRSYLEGSTEFGDSIADEWVVVYILRELSRQFDDIWVRVTDADGEFLLVEAANALPSWLNPDVAEHRVWIHRGQLLLIPKSINAATAAKKSADPVTLEQAVNFIQSTPQDLTRVPDVETEAFSRLNQYPARIPSLMHTAKVILPRRLAYVLHALPSSTSQAVEALYLRDSASSAPLTGKSGTSLAFPPHDLVSMCARFNRTSYAQLKTQDLPPPGPWASCVANASAENAEALKTGMKLACGYDMLISDPHNQDKRVLRETQLLLADLDEGQVALPSDEDIKHWPGLAESEDWLDVNFEDFEAELSGRKAASGSRRRTFKDSHAQDNLRRIVEQFQNFLSDENAGVEGAEMGHESDEDEDETDDDDDDDDVQIPEGQEEVDPAPAADDSHFADMMNQMLQLNGRHGRDIPSRGFVEADDSEAEDISYEDLQKISQMMEEELKGAGALNLNDTTSGAGDPGTDPDNMQYHLAKNILEALKHQSGRAGPASNLIGSMGLGLPPDADE